MRYISQLLRRPVEKLLQQLEWEGLSHPLCREGSSVILGKGAQLAGATIASEFPLPKTKEWGKGKGAGVGPSPAYSYSAQVAEVSVDEDTGEVTVHKVWAARV